jgi:hemolysin activation/secretion protein
MPPAAETELKPPQLAPVERFPAGPAIKIPESAPIKAPAGAENVRFVLNSLNVEGVTAYTPECIEKIYKKLIGNNVSLVEIYTVAEEIQRLYRDDGYFLARAILPAQSSQEGRLTIRVLEGSISEVVVQGDIGPVQQLVKNYLNHLLRERPIKLKTVERYLLLANDIPGLVVKGILRPAPDSVGAAQLVATVERKAVDASVTVDNLGSSYTGTWEFGATASLNSLTSLGEGFSLGGLWSEPWDGFNQGAKMGLMRFSLRPWSNGTYIKTLVSYGQSNPGGPIASFDAINTKLFVSGVIGYPIIRSRDKNLFVEAGLDYINSDTDLFKNEPFSRDKLRVFHLTLFGDCLDSWRGTNFASLGIRQGLPIFGTSEGGDALLSRPDGSGIFTSFNGKLSRTQPIYGPFSVMLKSAGQYAGSKVLSDEEFGVGGLDFGRGYNPREISDDSGLGFTGELQYTRPLDFRFCNRVQIYGFYDAGKVWDSPTNETTALTSAGGGVRAWFTSHLSVDLAVAKPLTLTSQRADNTKDPQILLQVMGLF